MHFINVAENNANFNDSRYFHGAFSSNFLVRVNTPVALYLRTAESRGHIVMYSLGRRARKSL